jgi:hypothetical protein
MDLDKEMDLLIKTFEKSASEPFTVMHTVRKQLGNIYNCGFDAGYETGSKKLENESN